jgi:WD40 repeat protein
MMATSVDGTWLTAGYEDGKVGVWNIRRFHAIGDLKMTVFSGHRYPYIADAAFSRDGRTLATADLSGELILWDVDRGVAMLKLDLVKLATRPQFGGYYEGIVMEFSPDDTALIVAIDTRVSEETDGHGSVFVVYAPHVHEPSR